MIPASGTFSFSNVNGELGRSSGAALSLNDPGSRLLTATLAALTPGSPISMNQMRGRAGFAFNAAMVSGASGSWSPSSASGVGAYQGISGAANPLGSVNGIGVREISSGRRITPPGVDYTDLKLNCPQPFARFWGFGVWHGANFVGRALYSDVTVMTDNFAVNGYLDYRFNISTLDLRPYAGQTLQFVFIV